MKDDDDEVSKRRGKPPKPRKPVVEKYSVRRLQAIRQNETKSALYHLTPKELKFVKAVATGMNHTEAIKSAGWRTDGDRAKMRSHRLMKQPVIRAALYELMVQSFDKSQIEVTQWLREVASIAFMPGDMLEGKPRWADKHNALKMVGEFQKLLEKSAPTTREVSIINLITQSTPPKTVAPVGTVIVHDAATTKRD